MNLALDIGINCGVDVASGERSFNFDLSCRCDLGCRATSDEDVSSGVGVTSGVDVPSGADLAFECMSDLQC